MFWKLNIRLLYSKNTSRFHLQHFHSWMLHASFTLRWDANYKIVVVNNIASKLTFEQHLFNVTYIYIYVVSIYLKRIVKTSLYSSIHSTQKKPFFPLFHPNEANSRPQTVLQRLRRHHKVHVESLQGHWSSVDQWNPSDLADSTLPRVGREMQTHHQLL